MRFHADICCGPAMLCLGPLFKFSGLCQTSAPHAFMRPPRGFTWQQSKAPVTKLRLLTVQAAAGGGVGVGVGVSVGNARGAGGGGAAGGGQTVAAQLAQLAALHESGALNDREFADAKGRVLAGGGNSGAPVPVAQPVAQAVPMAAPSAPPKMDDDVARI